MAQSPNQWLQALTEAKEDRPLRDPEHLWKKAGHLLIAERMWLKTMPLCSVLVSEDVLSNVWWTVLLKKMHRKRDCEKALAVWFNSTLGLIMLLGHRGETRGAWVDFKKPTLLSMPVLDVSRIREQQLNRLAGAYDGLAGKNVRPLLEMHNDPVRAAMDKAIAQALHLPDLSSLRELLAREPVICLALDRLLGPGSR
jgi:hypothetical protein